MNLHLGVKFLSDYKFHKGKITIGNQVIEVIQIEKDEIESLSFKKVLKLIKKLDKKSNKGFGGMMLAINGYDDIPEELYEIDETRKYLQKLVKKIPHILFYLSPINRMPTQVITALSDFEKYYRGPLSIEAYKKGEHTVKVMLSQENKDLMTNSIKRHVEKVKFEDKYEDLSNIYKFINGR